MQSSSSLENIKIYDLLGTQDILNVNLNKLVEVLKNIFVHHECNFQILSEEKLFAKYKNFDECRLSIINNNLLKNQHIIETLINLIFWNIYDNMTPLYHNYGKKILIMCAYLQHFKKGMCQNKFIEYRNNSNIFFQILYASNAYNYIKGVEKSIFPVMKKVFSNILFI